MISSALEACGDGAVLYADAFAEGLRPSRPMLVSEWAEKHRVLSREASSEPGPYRFDRVPFLRDIADALSPTSPWSEIVFKKSAQVGGSDGCGFNWIGYVIDQSPGPMMMVQPTIEMGESVSKQRLAPMFRDSPVLAGKIGPVSRSSGNTIREKYFPGGMLTIAGANSAATLASRPIRFLLLDEIDRYPLDADGEGCPVELAKKRTATFSRKKTLEISTPTIKGISKIEAAYDASTRGQYFVPCPHCAHYQTLEWAGIRWDRNPDGSPVLASVHYLCAGCGAQILPHHKGEMLRRGEWRHENPEARVLGFFINALYSPAGWYSWAEAVDDWHEAQKDPAKLKAFINTVLGESYELRGEDAAAWSFVYAKREPRPIGVVPARACLLTAGGDVQKDRIEVTVVAWRGRECWVVDHVVIMGETALDIDDPKGPWPELTKLIQREWSHECGAALKIERFAIDSGFQTSKVYEWARAQASRVVLPVKGSDTLATPVGAPRAQDFRTHDGKKVWRGVKLFMVGSPILKREILGRLRLPKPSDEQVAALGFPANYLHLPELAEDYCRQLTSETEVVKKGRGGREVREWHVSGRNEALDCMVYAFAAYHQLGAHRWTVEHWRQLAAQFEATGPAPPPPTSTAPAAPVEGKPAPTPAPPARAPEKRRDPPPSSFWAPRR